MSSADTSSETSSVITTRNTQLHDITDDDVTDGLSSNYQPETDDPQTEVDSEQDTDNLDRADSDAESAQLNDNNSFRYCSILEYFQWKERGFSDVEVFKRIKQRADSLGEDGFSFMTFRRIKNMLGLTGKYKFSNNVLDRNVYDCILKIGRRAGLNMMSGYIRKKHGISVPRDQLRDAMERVDPEAFNERRYYTHRQMQRRQIYAPYFGYTWSIDQNEKLRDYGIVFFMGVDAHSRMILFIRACRSKKSRPLLEEFRNAIVKFGIPENIRTDYGAENNLTGFFMQILAEYRNNQERDPVIHCRSIRNTRVEKMWGEVNTRISYNIKNALVNLENSADCIFNLNNDHHKFYVHSILIYIIPKMLDDFIEAWNGHRGRISKGRPEDLCTPNPCARYTSDDIPIVQDIIDKFEEVGGIINDDETFGFDPLEDYPDLVRQRQMQLETMFPKEIAIANIMHSVEEAEIILNDAIQWMMEWTEDCVEELLMRGTDTEDNSSNTDTEDILSNNEFGWN